MCLFDFHFRCCWFSPLIVLLSLFCSSLLFFFPPFSSLHRYISKTCGSSAQGLFYPVTRFPLSELTRNLKDHIFETWWMTSKLITVPEFVIVLKLKLSRVVLLSVIFEALAPSIVIIFVCTFACCPGVLLEVLCISQS